MKLLAVTETPLSALDLKALEQEWLTLESKAATSFFTSWSFIKVWLTTMGQNSSLLRVTDHQGTVGLVFCCAHTLRTHWLKTHQIWLNRTGEQRKDQIWSEFNDILCPVGREWAIRSAIFWYLEAQYPNVDEFLLGVSQASIEETPIPDALMQRVVWETTSYSVPLIDKFEQIDHYLATLSRNTRHQIRRTQKILEQDGPITLTPATNVEDALQAFDAAGVLHKQRWSGAQSGFNNQAFTTFHRSLITTLFEQGLVDLLTLKTGDTPVCYLYNFVYQGYVYFYLSGIRYTSDNRVKPGLLAHSLAISYYASKGMTVYDFMGGSGQYKQSLSHQTESLVISSFQRKRPDFLINRLIDKFKASRTKKQLLHDNYY